MWRTKDFYKSFFGYWEVLSTYRAYLGQGCTFTRGTVHAQCLCITYPCQWMFNLSRAVSKSIKWCGWKDARQREQVHLHVPVFTWRKGRERARYGHTYSASKDIRWGVLRAWYGHRLYLGRGIGTGTCIYLLVHAFKRMYVPAHTSM